MCKYCGIGSFGMVVSFQQWLPNLTTILSYTDHKSVPTVIGNCDVIHYDFLVIFPEYTTGLSKSCTPYRVCRVSNIKCCCVGRLTTHSHISVEKQTFGNECSNLVHSQRQRQPHSVANESGFFFLGGGVRRMYLDVVLTFRSKLLCPNSPIVTIHQQQTH